MVKLLFIVMNGNHVVNALTDLGLSDKESVVFMCLVGSGASTPAQISQRTSINRTTVYRLLESLELRGLVSRELDQNTTRFVANDVSVLNRLAQEHLDEAINLKKEIESVVDDLEGLESSKFASTTVNYFRGVQGLRQLLWNTLSAGDGNEVVGLGYRTWNEDVGRKFAEDLRQEYVNRNVLSRELLNSLPPKGSFTANSKYANRHYQAAIIDDSVLKIRYDTYIYSDVFAFYYTRGGELFGVEIHNKEIADSQKQIFNILWSMAEKM